MPTVTVAFFQATFVWAIFVHIRYISAVADPILTKLFGPILLGLSFLEPNIFGTIPFWTQIFFEPMSFFNNNFLDQKFLGPNFKLLAQKQFFLTKNSFNKMYFLPKFFSITKKIYQKLYQTKEI